jgi:hypothetical protein
MSDADVSIIIPPATVQAVIDHTAAFLAQNGVELEAKIRERNLDEKGLKKFAFFNPKNPYHGYYKFRLENGADAIVPTSADDAALASEEQASVNAEIRRQRALAAQVADAASVAAAAAAAPANDGGVDAGVKRAKTLDAALKRHQEACTAVGGAVDVTKEDELLAAVQKCTVAFPTVNVSVLEIEACKMTAQYVARNGEHLISMLDEQKFNDEVFGFLKPSHVLYTCFCKLVDAYSQIIHMGASKAKQMHVDAESAFEAWRNRRRPPGGQGEEFAGQ